ncbi:MAG TPA: hypothetical protein VHE30_08350 [Polyangiaceae bacterium]|nr:hypothetical protein [Polyangiaceae bacterium]
MKPAVAAGAMLALSVVAPPARAADSPSAPLVRDESHATLGMAELGVGLLTLPGAEVCNAQQAGCEKGDTSLALSAWPLFRRGNFAAGAGVMMGITSSTDAPRNDPPDIQRDHTRRYFTVEVTARYYVPFGARVEGWGGVTTGLGVVNDSFQSRNGVTDEAIIGPRGVTLLTEGYTIGLGVGMAYAVAKNWRVGGSVRLSNWFLPKTPLEDPLGDQASLRGRVTTFDFGLTLAYRTRLVF